MKKSNEPEYPFKTPDGYFDQFTEKMMDHVKSDKRKKSGIFLSKWFKYSSVAALFLIVLSIVIAQIQNETGLAVNSDTLNNHKPVLISDSGINKHFYNNEKSVYEDEYLSQDISDDEIIDWSASMDLSDEELVVLISNH